MRLYDPVLTWTLRWKWAVIAGALALMIATVPVYLKLGSEFMPPLEEGSILYMPTTMPGISIGEARKVLQVTDGSSGSSRRLRPCWEGGKGRDLDRPRAAFHAGDRDHPQTQIGMAQSGHMVFLVGSGVDEGSASPFDPGPHIPGRAHRPDE